MEQEGKGIGWWRTPETMLTGLRKFSSMVNGQVRPIEQQLCFDPRVANRLKFGRIIPEF
jgi:hypothetical protein